MEQPDLLNGAVEEVLRWVSPVHAFARTATRDVVVRDQQIATGDYVVMLYPSGNRDEDIWPLADAFDITRSFASAQVAFGFGPHLCLGAALARLELAVVLGELLPRFENFELMGKAHSMPSSLVYMIEDLQVLFK